MRFPNLFNRSPKREADTGAPAEQAPPQAAELSEEMRAEIAYAQGRYEAEQGIAAELEQQLSALIAARLHASDEGEKVRLGEEIEKVKQDQLRQGAHTTMAWKRLYRLTGINPNGSEATDTGEEVRP